MRVRAELAGPIKNVRDQLMMVKNVLDDVSGHDAGAQLDTQAVMQVMATAVARGPTSSSSCSPCTRTRRG